MIALSDAYQIYHGILSLAGLASTSEAEIVIPEAMPGLLFDDTAVICAPPAPIRRDYLSRVPSFLGDRVIVLFPMSAHVGLRYRHFELIRHAMCILRAGESPTFIQTDGFNSGVYPCVSREAAARLLFR